MQTLTKARNEEGVITEEATLPPKISTTVTLGLYEKSMPEPEFDITYSGDTYDDVKAMFVKMPEGDEYRLQCIFQNFTNKVFTAVIKEKHA